MSNNSATLNRKNSDISDISIINNISELESEKERLVLEGKYMEASEIKKKLEKLKINKKSKKKQNISNIQEKRSEQLVLLYTEEYNNLIQTWENKIKELAEKYESNEKKMEEEHTKQMEEYVEELMKKYPSMKYSKKYLETKAIEINLAKQDKFKEADIYRKKCDKMEEKETDEYNKKRNLTLQKKAEALSIKQEKEKKNINEKFEIKLELMKKERDKELEQLDIKYKNLKNDIDYIYKYQNFASDKKIINQTLRGNAAIRRMNNMINKNEKVDIVENIHQDDIHEEYDKEEPINDINHIDKDNINNSNNME